MASGRYVTPCDLGCLQTGRLNRPQEVGGQRKGGTAADARAVVNCV